MIFSLDYLAEIWVRISIFHNSLARHSCCFIRRRL